MTAADLDLAILVLAVVVALGCGLLVGHGVAVWLGRLAFEGRARRARAALADVVARGGPGPDTAAALRVLPRKLRVRAFAELAPSLGGPDREALARAAEEVGIPERARRMCRSRRWRRRLHGARLLALLGGGEHVVPPLLSDRRADVRAQAAEWAAGRRDPAIVERLVAMLDDPRPFARYTVMDSLIRTGGAAVPPLAAAIAAGAGPPAIEVAARIADPRLAEVAVARLADPDPAVRAWAARLLGALGGEVHAERVLALLEDPDASVRAAAAVALGRLGHWPAASALAARLGDPAWEVRRDAALALRALGPAGALLLKRTLRTGDAFARDMARQTLDLPEVRLRA